ncbi:MAG: sigma-54-dependent Fis family transcriptional regulator [Nannocystaceae bacterium]|nr:sigma 54-interacting transcriptional regulator [bacterium]
MESELDDVALTLRADGGELDGPLRRAWDRAAAFGVDQDGIGHDESIEPGSGLAGREAAVRDVIRSGRSVLDGLARDLARHHFALLLADHDGVVVRRMGGGEFESVADAVRLVEGAHWAENVRGTNAIGTALAEDLPVTVLGAAHYAQPNKSLVCYASPIRDPSGQTIAILDATGSLASADDFVSVAVRSAATALEDRLRLQHWPQRGPNSLRVLRQTLERCAVPAFVVERPGTVRASNDRARELLGRQPTTLDSVVGLQWADLQRLIESGDLSVDTAARLAQTFPHRQLHVEPVLDLRGDVWAAVVFVEPRTSTWRDRGTSTTQPELPKAFCRITGSDPDLRAVLHHAARVAATSLPILLCSETGTGKELLARAIHESSSRWSKPMVSLNCGAVQPELMASELFGYASGAFTGADPKGREGKLAAAAGGTLFLDELGEMPSALQVLLLRFLESGSYQRVGESKLRHVDVRIVCATCRELETLVHSGDFRQDLFYRIKGACLRIPPLRERRDLPELAEALLAELAAAESIEPAPRLTMAAEARLQAHAWPGNTRELKMVLHHALALARDAEFIDAEDLPLEDTRPCRPQLGADAPGVAPTPNTLDDHKRTALAGALRDANGNVSAAARSLGVARSTIYRQLRRYGLLPE